MLLVLQADPHKRETFLSAYEEELQALLGPNAEIVFLDVLQGYSTIVVTQITLIEGSGTADDVLAAVSAAAATVNSAAEAILGSSDESGSGSGSGSRSDNNDSGSSGVDGGSSINDVSSDEGQRRRVLSVSSQQQYHSAFDVMACGIIIVAGMYGLACYLMPSLATLPGKDLLTCEADIEVAGSTKSSS